MFCKYCGKKIPKSSKFCRYCGEEVNVPKSETESIKVKGVEENNYQSTNQGRTNVISNYFNVIKKYFIFKGRASRKEYWLFFLANLIISIGLGYFEGFFGIYLESDESILTTIYQLFILIPSISVGVRRMHDANESGWCFIIPIYNLIVTLRKGNPKTNKYGPPPND